MMWLAKPRQGRSWPGEVSPGKPPVWLGEASRVEAVCGLPRCGKASLDPVVSGFWRDRPRPGAGTVGSGSGTARQSVARSGKANIASAGVIAAQNVDGQALVTLGRRGISSWQL